MFTDYQMGPQHVLKPLNDIFEAAPDESFQALEPELRGSVYRLEAGRYCAALWTRSDLRAPPAVLFVARDLGRRGREQLLGILRRIAGPFRLVSNRHALNAYSRARSWFTISSLQGEAAGDAILDSTQGGAP